MNTAQRLNHLSERLVWRLLSKLRRLQLRVWPRGLESIPTLTGPFCGLSAICSVLSEGHAGATQVSHNPSVRQAAAQISEAPPLLKAGLDG